MAFWDKFNKTNQPLSSDENVEQMVNNDPVDDAERLFQTGGFYPPMDSIERIAKYKRGRKIFDGKTYDKKINPLETIKEIYRERYLDHTHLYDVYERAEKLLRKTPFSKQLHHLYIAINLIDILIVKVADLMVGEPPTFNSTKADGSVEQEALNRIVEENDLVQLMHQCVVGNGIRGDSWLKVYYAYRQDFSAMPKNIPMPQGVVPEAILELVNPLYVFPELSRNSDKRFRAVNIAPIEWTTENNVEQPYLNVERHVPGAILYERYKLYPNGVDNRYGTLVEIFRIGEKVPTGRNEDVVMTGVPHPLVFHVPHKQVDDTWEGISSIEKLESVLAAINDRIAQIDFILWKHADPTAYGPAIGDETIDWGGKYIEVDKNDVVPGYMVWDAQLQHAFSELELLLGVVFQVSETPQFIFGTTLAGAGNSAGGTSHTTSDAIKVRFFPLVSKVKRVRMNVDKAFRDALWTAQILDNFANNGVQGYTAYEPQYPRINWRDGLPRDEMTLAQVAQIRTGGRPNQSVVDAIKELDEIGEVQAQEKLKIIEEEQTQDSLVQTSALQPPKLNPLPNDITSGNEGMMNG